MIVVPDKTRTRMHAKGHGSKRVSTWRRFMSLVGVHRSILIEAFCCALFMTLLGISTSYFVQHLVDSVLVRGETQLLNALGIGMVAIVLFRTLFGSLRQYLLAHISRQVDLALISTYGGHILGLPMRFFETRRVGEIVSRVNDAARIREAISGMALTAVVDTVMVDISLVVLWNYDMPLAILAKVLVPLLMVTVAFHHPAIRRRSSEAMENEAKLSAHLIEDISGVETIKAFSLERARSAERETRLLRLAQSVFSLQKLGISMGGAAVVYTQVVEIWRKFRQLWHMIC